MIIWIGLLIVYKVLVSLYFDQFKDKIYIVTVILLCVMISFYFWPFRSLIHKMRICFMILLTKSIFPLGKNGVKFRDFMFADVLTSFSLSFTNLTVAICLIYCETCRNEFVQLRCHYNIAIPIISSIPYIFRFIQCINKIYYRSGYRIQIINALKYFTLLAYINIGYLYSLRILPKTIFIGVAAYSSLFALCYDLLVDWNLLHVKSSNFLLRNRIKFPKWFYYYAIVTNTFIRFLWFMNVIILPFPRDYIMLTVNCLEVYRRAQWILIRVENETLYNIERYRSYLPVPNLPLH
jgi:hypothetical protein